MNKKKTSIILVLVVIVLIVTFFIVNNNANQTFMEERVNYAIDYTNKNYESLDQYKIGKALMDEQSAAEEKIKTDYAAGDYTLESPFVVVDPYKQNNLSAFVMFSTDEAVSYSYNVQAKTTDGYPFEYTSTTMQSDNVVIPVVGLFEDYNNTVEITVTNKAGETQTSNVSIQTEKAESKYAEGSISVEEAEKEVGIKITAEQAAKTGVPLTPVTDATVKVDIKDESILDYSDGFILSEDYDIYDFDGNLRFSSLLGAGNNALKFDDGRYIVVNTDKMMYDMDVMGKVHQFAFPPVSDQNGEVLVFHHDTEVSPDGKYIYALAGYTSLENIEENREQYYRESFILKIDRETGKTVDVWDYSDEFAQEPQSIEKVSVADPLHMNSIDYYEDKDLIIVSMKNQSMVMAVSARNGEVEWIIKDPTAVSEENQKYLLEATDPESMIYTSGNHSAFVMNTEKYNSEGNDLYLSVFDNRYCVNEDQTPAWSTLETEATCAKSESSTMIIYHINLADNTVETMEEIEPESGRWSYIRSSVFTNHEGIYEIHFADMTAEDGTNITHSDLYVTDESGKQLAHVTFDGLTNVYRSRLINEDEIGTSLEANLESLK